MPLSSDDPAAELRGRGKASSVLGGTDADDAAEGAQEGRLIGEPALSRHGRESFAATFEAPTSRVHPCALHVLARTHADLGAEQPREAALAHLRPVGQRRDGQFGARMVGDVGHQLGDHVVAGPVGGQMSAELSLAPRSVQVDHQVASDVGGHRGAVVGAHDLQRQVDSGGDASRGPHTVADVDSVGVELHHGMRPCQLVGNRPVGGRTATRQQAGLRQQHGTATDRPHLITAPGQRP